MNDGAVTIWDDGGQDVFFTQQEGGFGPYREPVWIVGCVMPVSEAQLSLDKVSAAEADAITAFEMAVGTALGQVALVVRDLGGDPVEFLSFFLRSVDEITRDD